MADTAQKSAVQDDDHIEHHHTESAQEHVQNVTAAIARTDSHEDDDHVKLGWRTWSVVLVTLFGTTHREGFLQLSDGV